MLDPFLRPVKDALLRPVGRRLGAVHPTAVTGAALLLGLAAAATTWRGAFGAALLLWIGNRTLDGLDGIVARLHGRTSDLGGYLDLVADFVVYAAVPVAFALRPGAGPALERATIVLLAVFYVNAATWMVLSSVLEKRGRGAASRGETTSVTMPEGIIGGTETAVLYGLFFLLPERTVLLFWVMASLTAVTALQRVAWAVRRL